MRRNYEIAINVVFFFIIYFVLFAVLRVALAGTFYETLSGLISVVIAFYSRSFYRKLTKQILDSRNIE